MALEINRKYLLGEEALLQQAVREEKKPPGIWTQKGL